MAHLTTLIEQAMAHAFVHWHRGDRAGADGAWASSGAAMMHMTKLVGLFAAHGRVPVSGEIPEAQISFDPAEAIELDRTLATRSARAAAEAQGSSDDAKIAKACGRIAESCDAMARWAAGQPHPAAASNPAAFSSFEATLRRFVRSD